MRKKNRRYIIAAILSFYVTAAATAQDSEYISDDTVPLDDSLATGNGDDQDLFDENNDIMQERQEKSLFGERSGTEYDNFERDFEKEGLFELQEDGE